MSTVLTREEIPQEGGPKIKIKIPNNFKNIYSIQLRQEPVNREHQLLHLQVQIVSFSLSCKVYELKYICNGMVGQLPLARLTMLSSVCTWIRDF